MVLFFIFCLSERSEAQSERHLIFGDIICLLREFLLRSSICWNFAGMDLFFIILAQFYALKSSKRTSFFKKQILFFVFLTFVKEFIKIPTLNKNNYLIFFFVIVRNKFLT